MPESIKSVLNTLQESFLQLETENARLKRQNAEYQKYAESMARVFGGTVETPTPTNGHAVIRKNKRGHRLSDETRTQIVESYKSKDALPVREIAKKFGISPFTVYEVLKKVGVKKRRG